MIDFTKKENDDIKIDEKKLQTMVIRIYNIERKNAKTAFKTGKAIKEDICKIIEEEVKNVIKNYKIS